MGRPGLDPLLRCRRALRRRGITPRIAHRGLEFSHRLGWRRYVVVGNEQRSLDGLGHSERGADLIQHLLLPGAHLLGAEPQEAALLGGVGSCWAAATNHRRNASAS